MNSESNTDMNMIINKGRKYYLDVMRILAIFLVVFNHTSRKGFLLFMEYSPSYPEFWIYMVLSILCKVAVPLFFAVSGSLLLSKDEPLSKSLKRALRFAIILLAVSALYYLVGNPNPSFKAFLKNLYSGEIKTHLWFLYAYIAFLLMAPFLRAIVKSITEKQFIYLLVLYFIFCCLRVGAEYLLHLPGISDSIKFGWLNNNVIVFPIVGYYLDNKADVKRLKKSLPVMWLFCVLGVMLTVYLTYRVCNVDVMPDSDTAQKFFSRYVVLLLIAVFTTIKVVFDKDAGLIKGINPAINTGLLYLSKSTFIVYLFHLLVMSKIKVIKELPLTLIRWGWNDMIAGLVYTLAICLITSILGIVYYTLKNYVVRLWGGHFKKEEE